MASTGSTLTLKDPRQSPWMISFGLLGLLLFAWHIATAKPAFNLDISGVIFAILVVGVVGVVLDYGFNRLARLVSYAE